ncbi:MAG: hypothetical protein Kow00124_08240 [Anaerolineae bacterium]
MVRAIIESFLGPYGVRVLEFYETNSLIINSVVVLYGLIMVLAWTNLVNIRKRLVAAILEQIERSDTEIAEDSKVKRLLKAVSIPWEEAVAQARYPLIARQMALLPQRKTVERVRELISEEDLAKEVLRVLAAQRRRSERAG